MRGTRRQQVWERWRAACPYGMWTCPDGRNRDYRPILERRDGRVAACDPSEWVTWTKQEWFFTDANPPWRTGARKPAARETLKRINVVLAEWGVPPIEPLPRGVSTWCSDRPYINPWADVLAAA